MPDPTYVLDYSGVQVNERLGRGYTLSGGDVTQGNDTTASFAIEGITVSVGTGDDAETLMFTAATTGTAVIASGTVSYTSPTLSSTTASLGT